MSSKPEIMEKLVMQPASSSYLTLGNSYSHKGHQIEYSPHLVRTGKNYYDSKLANGRMSTAAEELAIQLGLERAGQDPRTAEAFNDLFARNEAHVHIWQWTETGLRVPKGRDPRKYETNGQGEKYWVRELLIGSDTVGEILVPEGNGRVVVEWDEVSGLPRVTEDIAFPHKPYTTHFWFNVNPGKDGVSGYQDVAVERRSGWLHDVAEWCLDVDASYARSDADSDGGFRPVRGSLVKIEKTITQINPTDPNEMEKDYGKLPLADFRQKYNL